MATKWNTLSGCNRFGDGSIVGFDSKIKQTWRKNEEIFLCLKLVELYPILACFGNSFDSILWYLFWEFSKTFSNPSDYSVEHTGARKRQREGTLERVVKIRQGGHREGLCVAGIASQRWRGRLLCFLVPFRFVFTFFPVGDGWNTTVLGPTVFFCAVRPHGSSAS